MDITTTNELKQLLMLLRDQGVTEYNTPKLSLKLSPMNAEPTPESAPKPNADVPEDVVRALSKLPAQYSKVMVGV